jgi:hypothetical protein
MARAASPPLVDGKPMQDANFDGCAELAFRVL